MRVSKLKQVNKFKVFHTFSQMFIEHLLSSQNGLSNSGGPRAQGRVQRGRGGAPQPGLPLGLAAQPAALEAVPESCPCRPVWDMTPAQSLSGSSLVAQMVKNLLQCRRPVFNP